MGTQEPVTITDAPCIMKNKGSRTLDFKIVVKSGCPNGPDYTFASKQVLTIIPGTQDKFGYPAMKTVSFPNFGVERT